MPGSEADEQRGSVAEPSPLFSHSGPGPLNVNVGSGSQLNPTQSEGTQNRQFNANTIYYTERAETPPPPCAVIPFRRDPDYVPRASLFDRIHHKLSAPAARVALVGLGGVGKSLLAIEYSHWTREQWSETWVFWLHASNSARFAESVQHVVDQLEIPGRNEQSANIFGLLEAWLRDGRRRWLLVLDNADDPGFLHEPPHTSESSKTKHPRTCMEYLPVCGHGSILFTSRDKNAAVALVDDVDIILVPPMDEEHAVALLEKKILNTVQTQHSRKDMIELVQALDCMPLAVTQAGAYIRQRAPRSSVRQYLEKLQKSDKSRTSLLDRDERNLRRDKEASNSIILTWQISFEHIRYSRPSAADLLALMSFCDRQAIPEVLLRASDGQRDANQDTNRGGKDEQRQETSTTIESSDSEEVEDPGSSVSEDDAFEDDLVTLEGYSFISRTTDAATFEMHRLVQLSTRRWLEVQGSAEQWKERFVCDLSIVFPPGNYENWTRCQTLLSHAQAAVPLKMGGREASLQWASVMYYASWYACERGMLPVAEKMSKLCNKVRMKELGEAHPSTLTSMGNLASTYLNQGRWGEAEELEVKVMETSKKVLGEAHPDTLSSMANLASTYWNQGRWGEAEELEVKVMETRMEVLGEADPDTLSSMANLASTYWNQGRWGEAEELGVKVMETSKKVLGEAHPSTLTSMANLASTYRNQGRWGNAEELEVKVIETSKKVLGEAHPGTLTSMANLASTYRNQGRWGEAEELEVKVIETRMKVLGEAHPSTLTSMANLASTYWNQGRWGEAEELDVKVMETSKKVLGEAHPNTLTSMANLASTYLNQGRWGEAEELFVKVVETSKKVLGEAHPSTLTSMANLASTYWNQGRWGEAEELGVKVMETRMEVLGEAHPDTLTSMANLAATHRS